MSNLQSISGFAALSEASYMDFWDNDFHVVVTAPGPVRNRLIAGGFSPQQAVDFVSHWRVIDHLPNQDSGFSATLFQRIDNDPESGLKAGDGA